LLLARALEEWIIHVVVVIISALLVFVRCADIKSSVTE